MQLSPLYLERIQAAELIGEQRGEQRGELKGQQDLVLRQLVRRLGNVSIEADTKVKALPLERLEELGEALLDFTQIDDLITWLEGNQ